MQEVKKQYQLVENLISQNGATMQHIEIIYGLADISINQKNDVKYGLKLSARAKELLEKLIFDKVGVDVWKLDEYCKANKVQVEELDLYWKIIKLETYDNFESFVLYMEKNRQFAKKFYLPRRKTLKVVVEDLMDLENRIIKFYGLSMPSRVGKSTICIFFLAWISLKRPNSHSAMGGHSGILAKGFYKELMNLFSTEEYTFAELFEYWHPGHVVVRDKSADEFTITLDQPDRFATITCRGIDGTWTGAVDVSKDGFLYVDDLANLCVFLMNNYSDNETVNAGTGKELTIKALTELVAQVVGYEGRIEWDTTRPNGTPRKLLDVSKAKSLGWSYRTELEDGIRMAYDDFLNNPVRAER